MVAIGDELLDLVRRVTGVDVTYADPPVALTGGFFTENHAFRLAGAPPDWQGPLVLRLFPITLIDDVVRCEVEVQRGVAAQGYPAPRVVHFDMGERLSGHRFLVMQRVPGRTLMGGEVSVGLLLRRGPALVAGLSTTTAELQSQLHQLDAAPIRRALGGTPHTLDRWFAHLHSEVGASAPGFADGVRWLEQNRPPPPSRPTICHGDLWPGNILVDGKTVTGVIDWTVATVAEPAFDVGFTCVSFDIVPIDVPRMMRGLVTNLSRSVRRRYVKAYRERNPTVDLTAKRYYEALRCTTELATVTRYRSAPSMHARPPWDSTADQMVDYFRERTGVTLTLPAPVRAAR